MSDQPEVAMAGSSFRPPHTLLRLLCEDFIYQMKDIRVLIALVTVTVPMVRLAGTVEPINPLQYKISGCTREGHQELTQKQ